MPLTPDAGADSIIVAENVSKRYKRTVALEDVSFSVPRFAAMAVVGPNGAGKTTLISIIAGLVFPTSGRVTIGGFPPGRTGASTGIATDRLGVYPDRSARANLRIEAHVRGLPHTACERVIAITNMAAYADRSVSTYSTGMRQRLQVAHALLSDPDLLVLDEPTNGMDPDGIDELRDLINDLRAQEKTILLCTHILSEADATCSHVLMLDNGVVRYAGPVRTQSDRVQMEIGATDAGRALDIINALDYVSDVHSSDGMLACTIPRAMKQRLLEDLVHCDLWPHHYTSREAGLHQLYRGLSGTAR